MHILFFFIKEKIQILSGGLFAEKHAVEGRFFKKRSYPKGHTSTTISLRYISAQRLSFL